MRITQDAIKRFIYKNKKEISLEMIKIKIVKLKL